MNQRRVTAYSRIFVAVYALAMIIALALSPHFVDPTGKAIGADFVCFWSAGRMALEGHAADAYSYERQYAMERKALPWKKDQAAPVLPWSYPPTFLAVAAALALLPYGAALGAFMAATLAIYLAVIRGILPDRGALWAALAFPAVFSNLAHGQNGFLTAGLLGGALVLLERRPWTSGILFGLVAYKPQFAVFIPLALLAGRRWRTMFAAGLTVVGTAAASWAILGGQPWLEFFAGIETTRTLLVEQAAAGLEKFQSVFAAMRMMGGGIELAYAAQATVAVVAAAAVVWAWRGTASAPLKGAVLAIATLMATPYAFDYDLVLLALPIAWLAAIGLHEGFLEWERITLLAAWLLPLFSRMMGRYLHLPVAPLVLALLLAVTLRRIASVSET